jgi:hypothetical protein
MTRDQYRGTIREEELHEFACSLELDMLAPIGPMDLAGRVGNLAYHETKMLPHVDCNTVTLVLFQVWKRMEKIIFDDGTSNSKSVPGKARHETGKRLAKAQRQ